MVDERAGGGGVPDAPKPTTTPPNGVGLVGKPVESPLADDSESIPQHPLMLQSHGPRARRVWIVAAFAAAAAAAGWYAWTRFAPVEVDQRATAPAAERGFQDCDACPHMLRVPAGQFLMGSPDEDPDAGPEERPRHRVSIDAPFAVSRTEITFAQWFACVDDGGCGGYHPDHEGWGGSSRPVINVSWHDAYSYIRWLRVRTGKAYRLPTEAEWEYATRAGSTTRYWWGDDIGTGQAVCRGCGSRWDDQETAPVGSFAANPLGLLDVHGNVWEWVEDCWTKDYAEASPVGLPPVARRGCDKRVVRGGSWDTSPLQLRSAARGWGSADGRDNIIGFRVALSLDAPPASSTSPASTSPASTSPFPASPSPASPPAASPPSRPR